MEERPAGKGIFHITCASTGDAETAPWRFVLQGQCPELKRLAEATSCYWLSAIPKTQASAQSAEVGMLNLGLRCAFRWNYPWTTAQEKPDGKLEKCTIPVSAGSGEHRSTSELWGGMWTDILGWISLRWWICPVTCAVLWDKRSCFRHTFYFKVHKVAKKKNKVHRKCAAVEDLKELALYWLKAMLWGGLVIQVKHLHKQQ